MLTYFQAAKAVKVFTAYKTLTLAYWQDGTSPTLREQLMMLYPEANTSAQRLGLGVMAQSYPAPMFGGPVIPVNMLYAAVDQEQGHSRISRDSIMDTINRCLATAAAVKHRLFWRQLVNPVWWIVETIAYVLRIPFMILRRAGVPAQVEESIWGNIVKVFFFVVLVLASVYWGLDISPKDLLNLVK